MRIFQILKNFEVEVSLNFFLDQGDCWGQLGHEDWIQRHQWSTHTHTHVLEVCQVSPCQIFEGKNNILYKWETPEQTVEIRRRCCCFDLVNVLQDFKKVVSWLIYFIFLSLSTVLVCGLLNSPWLRSNSFSRMVEIHHKLCTATAGGCCVMGNIITIETPLLHIWLQNRDRGQKLPQGSFDL